MNILVTDDDEEIIFLIKHMFAKLYPEIEIHTAMDGKTGFELFNSLTKKGIKLDLVVLDIKMPGISGLEVGRRILDNHKDIPVILFTAHYSQDVKKHAESIGIKTILKKSMGFKRLVSSIVEYASSFKK